MKVRDLKNGLEKSAGKAQVNPMLTSVSHWMKIISESPRGQYVANTIRDTETLEKLVHIGVISLKRGSGTEIIAQLTEDGKELYRDFMGLGYYL